MDDKYWYADPRIASVALLMFATGFGLGAQWAGRLAKPTIRRFEAVPSWIHTVKQTSLIMFIIALVALGLILIIEYREGNINIPTEDNDGSE